MRELPESVARKGMACWHKSRINIRNPYLKKMVPPIILQECTKCHVLIARQIVWEENANKEMVMKERRSFLQAEEVPWSNIVKTCKEFHVVESKNDEEDDSGEAAVG